MEPIIGSGDYTVRQEHNGSGDNVYGNKIINVCQNLAPEALRKPIELILSNVRNRKTDIAKAQFEAIKSSPLDSNGEVVLGVLSVHLDLIENEAKSKVRNLLLSTLKNSTDSVLRDLCLATLIRLDAKNNQVDDARQRYLQAGTSHSYSREAFFEFIATAEELEQAYEKNRIDLDENQLNGLVRGAFRAQHFEFSLNVANRLNDIFPSFNSKILLLFATAYNLERKLTNRHFWIITASLKAEIIKLIDEVVFLINESKGTDSRLFNIAAPYLDYTRCEYQTLSDICWKYVDEIEKNHPAIAARLHASYGNDISRIKDEFDYRYKKAQKDKSYRTELLSELSSNKELSSVDFAIFSVSS